MDNQIYENTPVIGKGVINSYSSSYKKYKTPVIFISSSESSDDETNRRNGNTSPVLKLASTRVSQAVNRHSATTIHDCDVPVVSTPQVKKTLFDVFKNTSTDIDVATVDDKIASYDKKACISALSMNTPRSVKHTNCYVTQTPKFKPVVLSSDDEDNMEDASAATPYAPNSSKPKFSFLKSLSPSVPDSEANCDALRYRRDFAKLRQKLALDLFALYNEKIFENKLPKDMKIEWNSYLRTTAGYCTRRGSTVSISLSTPILKSAEKLRDTLLHELCHAAVFVIDKTKEGHGPLWQAYAIKCRMIFPDIAIPQRCHNYDIEYRFKYVCEGCGTITGRQKNPMDTSKYRCKHCKGRFKVLGK